MKKKNILKRNLDFTRIIQNQKHHHFESFLIYIEKAPMDTYHFGISVSKKIGCAVKRNHIKRQIRSILSKKDYQNNFNCIIIVKRKYLKKNYQQIELELNTILENFNIIKEQ